MGSLQFQYSCVVGDKGLEGIPNRRHPNTLQIATSFLAIGKEEVCWAKSRSKEPLEFLGRCQTRRRLLDVEIFQGQRHAGRVPRTERPREPLRAASAPGPQDPRLGDRRQDETRGTGFWAPGGGEGEVGGS